MSHQSARLLLDHMNLLTGLDRSLPVLDLACGTGRNGLALASQGLSVVFADKSVIALGVVQQRLLEGGLSARVWQVDLEQPQVNPLSALSFGAIICFLYLHRPLFPAIHQAVMPGGLLVYQTFTTDQTRFGRPNNPDFLLQPGELKAEFQGWELIHDFEGVLQNPSRAVAQIVARKPCQFSTQTRGWAPGEDRTLGTVVGGQSGHSRIATPQTHSGTFPALNCDNGPIQLTGMML